MPQKAYAYLFILCILLIQGIVATYLKENVGEPSKLLARTKRVINRIPGEDVPIELGVAPYVVNIKNDRHMHCVGSILSQRTVITASRCVILEISIYKVLSGAIYTYLGDIHNIIEKKTHIPQTSGIIRNGIALLIVHPPFLYGRNTGKIDLHVAPILGGMQGTITGWGSYLNLRRAETAHSKRLRSISIPILEHRECVDSYRHILRITDTEICTFDEDKKCGITDAGAPLTINNLLVGVYFGGFGPKGKICEASPDVFAFVQHPEYSQWIMRNIVQ